MKTHLNLVLILAIFGSIVSINSLSFASSKKIYPFKKASVVYEFKLLKKIKKFDNKKLISKKFNSKHYKEVDKGTIVRSIKNYGQTEAYYTKNQRVNNTQAILENDTIKLIDYNEERCELRAKEDVELVYILRYLFKNIDKQNYQSMVTYQLLKTKNISKSLKAGVYQINRKNFKAKGTIITSPKFKGLLVVANGTFKNAKGERVTVTLKAKSIQPIVDEQAFIIKNEITCE